MKLMLCVKCNDIFKLSYDLKACKCGACAGMYTDDLNAAVTGSDDKAFVLGFHNGSLVGALRQQIASGDLPATMGYGDKIVSPGREFTSFIIPKSAPTVKWVTQDELYEIDEKCTAEREQREAVLVAGRHVNGE